MRRSPVATALAVAVLVCAWGGGAAAQSPGASPPPISTAGGAEGRMATPDEEDLFHFPIDGPSLLRLTVEPLDPLLDPVIELHGPDGAWMATNDDAFGGEPEGMIERVISTPGEYSALVRSAGQGSTGRYRASAIVIPQVLLTSGETVTSSFDDRASERLFSFPATEGRMGAIRMGTGPGPYGYLTGPDGVETSPLTTSINGDLVFLVLPWATGQYVLHVYGNGAWGPFTVQSLTTDHVNSSVFPTRLNYGDQLDRTLGEGEGYRFGGRAGDRVTISMWDYGEMDPYLVLLGPDGTEVARDDDSGGDYDARIEVVLPTSGEYRVLARDLSNRVGDSYGIALWNE